MNPRASRFLSSVPAATLLLNGLALGQAPTLTATIGFVAPTAMDSILNATSGQRNLVIGGGGIVQIRSGASGALLGSLAAGPSGSGFGDAVATVGDQNGDGQEDILVGAPFANGNGQAFLFSGSRGAGFPLLATINPTPANVTIAATGFTNTAMAFGWSVSRLDNLNGAGSQEFAIGAPRWQSQPFGFGVDRLGLVEIGTTDLGPGAPALTTLFGGRPLEEFGFSVATLRNLPGSGADAIASFAIGSPSPLDPNDSGAVQVFSGLILGLSQATALISAFNYPTRRDMGTTLSATDTNGDGQDDVLTGLPDIGNAATATSAHVRFGGAFTAWQNLGTVVPTFPTLNVGFSVSECGSFDLAPGDEVLAGAPDASGSPVAVPGHAFILSSFAPSPGIVHDIVAPNGDPSFGRVVSEVDPALQRFAVAAPATNQVFLFN